MRVLITGGAGFIGSHCADHYLNAGHDVVVMDNLETASMRNIEHLVENATVITIETLPNNSMKFEIGLIKL